MMSESNALQNSSTQIDKTSSVPSAKANSKLIGEFTCNICNITYGWKRSLARHNRMAHPKKPLRLPKFMPRDQKVGSTGSTSNVNKINRRKPAKVNPKLVGAFTCNICNITYKWKRSLNGHNQKVHPKKSQILVSRCLSVNLTPSTISNRSPDSGDRMSSANELSVSLQQLPKIKYLSKKFCDSLTSPTKSSIRNSHGVGNKSSFREHRPRRRTKICSKSLIGFVNEYRKIVPTTVPNLKNRLGNASSARSRTKTKKVVEKLPPPDIASGSLPENT